MPNSGSTRHGTRANRGHFNPLDNIIVPKVNFRATGYAFFFGGNIGISGLCYIKKTGIGFCFEAGSWDWIFKGVTQLWLLYFSNQQHRKCW